MRQGLVVLVLMLSVVATLRYPFFGALALMLAMVLRDTLYVETYGYWFTYHGYEVLYIALGISVIVLRPYLLGDFTPRSMIDWGMVGFFLALVISAIVNGVDVLGSKHIELFTKAVILYFFVSRLASTPSCLTATVVSLIVSAAYLAYLAWTKQRSGELVFARPYGMSRYHEFALLMVMTLPLVGTMLGKRRLLLPFRLFLFGCVPLFVLVTMRSQSRSAMVGMAAGFVLLVWYYRRRWYWLLPAVPFVVYAIAHNPDAVLGRLTSIWTHELEGEEDGSIRSRFEQMRAAKNAIRSNPIFGIGPRQFFVRYGEFQDREDALLHSGEVQYTMHSVPLLILTEEGLLGAATFLLIVLGSFRALLYAGRKTRGDPFLEPVAVVAAGSSIALLSWMALALARSGMWTPNIYATVALAEAARRVIRAHLAERAGEEERQGTTVPTTYAPYGIPETDIVFQ